MRLGPYQKPLMLAVGVHLLVALVLSLNLEFEPRPVSAPPATQTEVVQATAVDESKVQEQLDRIKAAERKKQEQEAARQRELEQKAQQAERRRQAEEQRLARLKREREEQARKQKEEAKRLAELERKQKAEAERLARIERQKQEEAERLARIEQQKKEEAERLARLQEEQRKAEDEKRRRQEEEERRKQIEAEEQRLKAEQARLEAAQRSRNREESLRFIAQIQDKVQRNWINPLSGRSGLECVVRVRLNASGKVLLAQVVKGSGSEVFDRAVETAVLKASPLPLPKDPSIMEGFPELRFKFRPEK
ncbi:MAG: cell envelope integrity protein TolA [Gammaproteobacteria bacterium]|nr:cell envelope integrity protein TolA [Gammaproteobacteria bacterium]